MKSRFPVLLLFVHLSSAERIPILEEKKYRIISHAQHVSQQRQELEIPEPKSQLNVNEKYSPDGYLEKHFSEPPIHIMDAEKDNLPISMPLDDLPSHDDIPVPIPYDEDEMRRNLEDIFVPHADDEIIEPPKPPNHIMEGEKDDGIPVPIPYKEGEEAAEPPILIMEGEKDNLPIPMPLDEHPNDDIPVPIPYEGGEEGAEPPILIMEGKKDELQIPMPLDDLPSHDDIPVPIPYDEDETRRSLEEIGDDEVTGPPIHILNRDKDDLPVPVPFDEHPSDDEAPVPILYGDAVSHGKRRYLRSRN